MNVAEILLRVKKTFGDEAGIEIDDPIIINWINDGMVDIARHTECLQDELKLSSVTSQKAYSLPSNYLGMKRLTYNGSKLEQIAIEDLDELDNSRDISNNIGEPYYFYIWAKQLNFYPIPATSEVLNIAMMFFRTPNPVLVSADIPELPVGMHEDIVRFVLARAKELDEESGDAQLIWGDYQNRLSFSKDEHNNQFHDSYPSIRCLTADEGEY